MPMNKEVQQCRDNCEKIANEIRTIANRIPDQRSREMLTLGASHMEMCIHSCDEVLMMP